MQLPPERPVPVFESVKVKVEVPEEAAEKQTVSDEVVTDPVLDEHREIVEEMIEEIVVDESVEEMSVDVIEEMAIEQNVDSLAVEEMGAQKGIEVVAEGIVKDETAEQVVLAGGEEEMALSEEYNLEEEQVYEFVLDPELCEEIGPDLLAEFVSKLTPELFSRLAAGEMDAEGGEGPNTRALEICVEKAEEEKGVLQSLVEVQEVEEENVVEVPVEGDENFADVDVPIEEEHAEVIIDDGEPEVADIELDLDPLVIPVVGEVIMDSLGPDLVPPPAETTIVIESTADYDDEVVPRSKTRGSSGRSRRRHRHSRSSRRSRE
ncbi:hypothetical protein HPB51_001483 [Rhipicephalus microplus]|uniref:Uncharacterized protein n=1 Tax=Rhipicephalus microplus TaxID=6941 RepID=A0A9J6EVQ9_RHIMP|nr:hypothetical protein HPB51_001483 [Rhipicephalus microplus]